MITDKYMRFIRNTDTPVTTTIPLPFGQTDLPAPTDGSGPYSGFWLVVSSPNPGVAAMTFTLESSDLEAGPYTTVATFTSRALTTNAGTILKVPVPFRVKNWVRVTASAALPLDIFFTIGVVKGVEDND
jgi:hypothetical protein